MDILDLARPRAARMPDAAADFAALPPLPPGGPAPNALEHARRMLARAERGRAVNDRRIGLAARRDRWEEAGRHAERWQRAQRSVDHWQAVLQRLLASRGPYRFDDAEPFVRVLRVLGAGQLRAGGAVRGRELLRQLWGTHQGIFLHGANEARARQWAGREARRVNGTVERDPAHVAGGRPHFHIRRPDGTRSAHIFYGQAPAGEFFETD